MRPDEVIDCLLGADGPLYARALLDASIRLSRRNARNPALAATAGTRKPTIRVRPGSGERGLGLLTQREVAVILRISERAVRSIEKRAFDKIRRHPAMRDFWHEWTGGEIKETDAWALTNAEVAAVYALARSPAEQQALCKLLSALRLSPQFLP